MSRRSRQGDTEGVSGEECERGLNHLSLGESGGLPQKIVNSFVLSPTI